MTQTTTDYLFQATTAVPDRSFSAAATNGGLGKFDDHLSQASSFAGDDSSGFGGAQRADSSRRDDNNSRWSPNSSSSYNDGSSHTSQTSPSDHNGSRDTTSASCSNSENSRHDDHDDDKPDDTTATEAAGASQHNSKPANSKNEHAEKAEATEAVKAAAVNKKSGALDGQNNLHETAEGKDAAGGPAADAKHAENAAKLATKAAEDEAQSKQNKDAAIATEKKSKEEKAAKNSTPKAKSNPSASDGSGPDKAAAARATAAGETAADAAASEQAKADAAAAVGNKSAAKRTPDSDDKQDGESLDARADLQAAARNDAAVAKFDTAQLAAGTANIPDTGANASSKRKNGDAATKPIEAKGEAPAAAFARMSRSNNSSANSSTSGANESPQVDPSRFIGRVAKAFQTAHDRGGTLQLRLSPPELGALRIELNVKDGVMSASLQTENANARKLLLDHLPALRDRLAEQNIRVDRFDVDVRQDGAGGQADARGWQQQQHSQHQPDQSAPRRPIPTQPKASAVAPPERTTSVPTVGDAGLNLIV